MELWKSIPGYEGLYEASTEGRIRTAEGKVTSSARFPHRVWKQRIMKFKYMNRKDTDKRDARVCLWKDGKERTFLVARLIALTWCNGYTDGLTVNHIDGDTENNRRENLEWVSLGENIRKGFTTGLYANAEKPCILMDENGKCFRYRSQSEASASLGRHRHYITCCISKATPVRAADGTIYHVVN